MLSATHPKSQRCFELVGFAVLLKHPASKKHWQPCNLPRGRYYVLVCWIQDDDTGKFGQTMNSCVSVSVRRLRIALRARPNAQTQKALDEVKDWLARRDVFSLYPEYV